MHYGYGGCGEFEQAMSLKGVEGPYTHTWPNDLETPLFGFAQRNQSLFDVRAHRVVRATELLHGKPWRMLSRRHRQMKNLLLFDPPERLIASFVAVDQQI
ncbi:hypothetical protein QTI51_36760 [Variovorax sp. J22G73]|uniref:hypothetical protein n=1 Tax=unclassified Variovorax TaxID=663243 RepID=UPI002577A7E5|nr:MULTISPECIES: hypothetical protein [unclassified Variovorax]MDM0010538.1 hypothetical protein [Variovorax sp. J22R203]MDM0102880.1 hypothetical protein [Variovorax sp. J22G73]